MNLSRGELIDKLENEWFGSPKPTVLERRDPELAEQLSTLVSLVRAGIAVKTTRAKESA